MATTAEPLVSIIMPALNEERYIANAINSILPRSGAFGYELLVLDGGSTDGTREIVGRMAAANPNIRLVLNLGRIQAAGMNVGARAASAASRYLIRADCHSGYPERFVELCVNALVSSGAASVVVPMRTEGTSCLQRAIAAAQNSPVGNGYSKHRIGSGSMFVEHGHHAAFEKAAFLQVDGYDESFTHNEDAELDARFVRAGKRIYLVSEAAISYFPRESLTTLARQYLRYGAGRAQTVLKHRLVPQLRQILPPMVLLLCAVSLVAGLFDPRALLIAAAYLGAGLLWGVLLALRRADPCLVLSGPAAIVMHMSWAGGFIGHLSARVLRSWRASTPVRSHSP